MRKIFCLFLLISASLFLNGCATNASTSQMTIAPKLPDRIHNKSLLGNISVGSVAGGHETNPMWTSQINNSNFKIALEDSLKYANLYQTADAAKYVLDANLIKLTQPVLGFDLTVGCVVHYKLQNVTSNRVVFDKDINSSYTARLQDSLYAVSRLKMANEGAARANINALIKELYQLPKL